MDTERDHRANHLTRRDFLRTVALVSAAAGLPGCLPAGSVLQLKEGVTPSLWRKGVCRYCGTGCGLEMGIFDGRVVALRGNSDYPVNKGLLCLKGLSLAHVMYSEERALQPLVKRGGSMEPAAWDTALDLVAGKLKEAIEKHGPDAVAIYMGAQLFTEEIYIANKLFKGVLGSNHVEANARLCMSSAVTGFMTTFGADEPPGSYDDIEHSDCFFLIGANMAEQHPVIFGRILQRRAQNRDVRIIVADPRMTPTAAHADLWLPFLPGADLALMNSMACVLEQDGHWDHEFIARHTMLAEDGGAWGPEKEVSMEAFKEFLADYAPEKVAASVGVGAADIRKAAQIFGRSKAPMTLWTMGLNQRIWGTWANNLAYNLHLLTGKICSPGATALSMTGQPNACGGIRECGGLSHALPAHRVVAKPEDRAAMERFWNVPPGSIRPKPGYHTVEMFERLNRGDIKFLWILCTNPAQSMPDLNKYRQGMAGDAFIVVQDIFPPTQVLPDKFPNRTAEIADVFLPVAFWAEKGGVFGNTERRSMLTEKAVEAPDGLRADWEVMVDIARRAGYEKHFNYPNREAIWNEYREVTRGTDQDLFGATYEAMLKSNGIQWPCPTPGKSGSARRYVLASDQHLQRLVADGKIPKPADGIYFYGHKDGRARIFKRPQRPPAETPDRDYPLYLTTGRVVHHWHTATMTMRVPWLKEAVPSAFVEMNEDDAARLVVVDGQTVKVVTRRGELTLTARVPRLERQQPTGLAGRISIPRPGVVFIPFFDAHLLVNLLTVDAVDAMSKEPEFKICACRVERV